MPNAIAYVYKEKIKAYRTTRYVVGCCHIEPLPTYYYGGYPNPKEYYVVLNTNPLFYNRYNNSFETLHTRQNIKPFIFTKKEAEELVNAISQSQQIIQVVSRRNRETSSFKFFPQIQRPKYKVVNFWYGNKVFRQTYNTDIINNIISKNKILSKENIDMYNQNNRYSHWNFTNGKRFSKYAKGNPNIHKCINKLKSFMPNAKYEI